MFSLFLLLYPFWNGLFSTNGGLRQMAFKITPEHQSYTEVVLSTDYYYFFRTSCFKHFLFTIISVTKRIWLRSIITEVYLRTKIWNISKWWREGWDWERSFSSTISKHILNPLAQFEVADVLRKALITLWVDVFEVSSSLVRRKWNVEGTQRLGWGR